MNANYTIPARARLAAFVGAVLASALVLGSTVAGMQPKDEASANLVALHRVSVSATATR
jgi:hypothetical protein